MNLKLVDGTVSGNVGLEFPYGGGDAFRGYLKTLVGCLWKPAPLKMWTAPSELIEPITDTAVKLGYTIVDERTSPMLFDDVCVRATEDTGVLPWQVEAIKRGIQEGTLLVNFDTGLGKSRTALEIYRYSGVKLGIIVCPASVRGTWLAQCQRWLGSLCTYEVLEGDDVDEYDISIVSYEWLRDHGSKLRHGDFGLLVFDEIHYIKNGRSDRSKAALALSENNPHAIKLGLTATPVANTLDDLWHQFHVLSPGRFSSWMRFVKHYFTFTEGSYGGLKVEGVDPEKEEELRWRLDQLMIRKTKSEVAHLLPALTVNLNWHKEYSVTCGVTHTRESLEEFTKQVAPTKVRICVEKILEHIEGLSKGEGYKICIVTHLKSTADAIAGLLRQKLATDNEDPVECVHGDISNKKRDLVIARSATRDKSILVCTMHSVGTGKDELKIFKNVVFAEMYWSPQVVIQTLGRFVRMGSPDGGVNVELIGLRGTIDEQIAMSLERKINDALKVGGLGRDGELMSTAFDTKIDEDDFLELLREQLHVVTSSDAYGVVL